MSVQFIKKLIPLSVRDGLRNRRIKPVIQYLYRRELEQFIRTSDRLDSAHVARVMKQYGYNNKWAAVYTVLNGNPSQEYIPEDFFQIHVLPRMNRMSLIKAYQDKNMYDLTELKKFTIPALVRKIRHSYFDQDYQVITKSKVVEILSGYTKDIVIKPAIESGSGKDVWIGASSEAANELFMRNSCADIIVQECLEGNNFSKKINPSSFNTVRCMTAFTGENYVVLACALRVGRSGTRIDNQNTGGLVIGLQENGDLCDFALDKYLISYEKHPDSGFLFKGQTLPGMAEIRSACVEAHKALPHFGLISWDVALDSAGKVRIIELNIDWQGINLFQSYLGPLMGPYREQICQTFDIPSWIKTRPNNLRTGQ